MKEMLADLVEQLRSLAYIIPAAFGGFIDYLNQVQRKSKHWSCMSFLTHMLSALFFGWMAGVIAAEAGYSASVIAASGGFGGFLGVRLADLIIYSVMKVNRRK